MYPLRHSSCLINPSNVSAGTGNMVPLNVIQQPPPVQSVPTSYSNSQSLGNIAVVTMQNIPNFHPAVGSFISQQSLQVQNIPGFVPQVQQQNSVVPGLPVSTTVGTPLPSAINTNFITTQVSQCSSVANVSSTSSSLSDSVVKSVNSVKTQSSYSQQPIPPSNVGDPVCHTSNQTISSSTPQPMINQTYQQNYQLPNLAQQQSMVENFQQPNLLTDDLSALSHSPSPQTKSMGVGITTQYHSQPSIPQHEPQMPTTSASTAPMLGSQVSSSDMSNVSFRQDLPENSSCNLASSDCNTASKPNANANANTNLVKSVTLTIPYASFQQNTNAQMLTRQFTKIDPLPLQQTAPVILLQQPSPTAFVITGDAPSVPESYTQNTSSVLQYHSQQHMMSGFGPVSSENYALSPAMTPVPTPNQPSTPIAGAPNTLPLLHLRPQIPGANVQCVSKSSPVLQNAEQTCKLNQMRNFQAEHSQFPGIVYSSKVDQTLNYHIPQSCVNVMGSQVYQSDITNISHINKQLLNIQINKPLQYNQQSDTQKEQRQQILYSASAETKNILKVSDIHHLVQEAMQNAGEMLEASLHYADQSVSSDLDKQICANLEVNSVETTDTANFSPQQICTEEETQLVSECSKKDQEEIGTQTTPSLACESTVVDSSVSREIDTDSSVLCPVPGDTEEPVQTSEAVHMMQGLPVPSSVSEEMAAQSHMQYSRRNSSAMSSVQGSPTRSTTKVEDGYFLSRSFNLSKIELQWEQ